MHVLYCVRYNAMHMLYDRTRGTMYKDASLSAFPPKSEDDASLNKCKSEYITMHYFPILFTT